MTNSDNNINHNVCFICGNNEFSNTTIHYKQCNMCGHELINAISDDVFIVNDILDVDIIKKKDLLEEFKGRVLFNIKNKKDFLIDVGSSSGRFLYHNNNYFKNYIGIEVTKECIDFSTGVLGLNIVDDISKISGEIISVVTFWHSIEHIPCNIIENILNHINQYSNRETKVIISIPNNDSLMYKLFKKNFPYYDFKCHIHQFSSCSIDILLGKYSFKNESYFFSFAYSIFGYLQGFMNSCNSIHNFVYYYTKRGEPYGMSPAKLKILYLYNVILAGIFLLPSVVLCIFDLIFKNKSGVLTICYGRKEK